MIMSKYKGDLAGFPDEVVDWMLDQQVAQGNPRNVGVFEKNKTTDTYKGGFNWEIAVVPRCYIGRQYEFCKQVIEYRKFDLLAELYPKKWEFEPEIDLDALPKPENVVVQLDVLDKMRFKAACAAMRGILSNPHYPSDLNENKVAAASVTYADALIEALKKEKQDDTTTTP